MSLSMDLKIRGQYCYAPLVLNGAPTASSGGFGMMMGMGGMPGGMGGGMTSGGPGGRPGGF